MNYQLLNEVFTADFNLNGLLAHRQSWEHGNRFFYMDSPRRSNGLFLLTDCSALYELPDGTEIHASAGDVMLLPKGANYTVSFDIPPGKISHPIIINFRLSQPDGSEPSLGCNVIRLCRDNGSLLPMFASAAQLYKEASSAKLKAKVYELFGTVFPLLDLDECCIAHINSHYTDRFSVPELAKRCALSETVYRKRFRQLTGLSPVQYINRLKINKACQMLHSEDINPKDISEFLNFYNLPYFYKVFKDLTGLTPNQYRDQIIHSHQDSDIAN